MESVICSWRRRRWTFVSALLLAPLLSTAMPGLARAFPYQIASGAIFQPADASPSEAVPLTGHFELIHFGVCVHPCEPNEYGMTDIVFDLGGDSFSNGIVDQIHGGPLFNFSTIKVQEDGSIQPGGAIAERTITETGTLTNDPHNHAEYELFVEQALGPFVFVGNDPREVIYSDPRGTWPIEVTLAFALREKTGMSRFGWNGNGGIYVNEIDYDQDLYLGYVIFTAHAVPEPGTGLLVGFGFLGLGWRRHARTRDSVPDAMTVQVTRGRIVSDDDGRDTPRGLRPGTRVVREVQWK